MRYKKFLKEGLTHLLLQVKSDKSEEELVQLAKKADIQLASAS